MSKRGLLQYDNAVVSYEVMRTTQNEIMIELFSDYWIINKTTEMLMCSENIVFNSRFFFADSYPVTYSSTPAANPQLTPLFYSSLSRGITEASKHELRIRANSYEWSAPFSMDTVDLDGSIEVLAVSLLER